MRVEKFDDVSPREVRSAAKKLVGPAPRPDQVQLAALQAVLDIAEQPLSERERDAVDAALALARGALPAAAPLLDQGKCPTLASTVLSCATALSNFSCLLRELRCFSQAAADNSLRLQFPKLDEVGMATDFY